MRSQFPAALSLIISAILAMPILVQSEPEALVDLRARYEAQNEIETAPLETLNKNFAGAMQRQLEEESKSGKLDQVLAVKEEIERFAGGKNFSESAYRNGLSDDRMIRDFQEKYLLSRKKIESEVRVRQLRLLKIYLQQLTVLEESFTKELKINEALHIKEERGKIASKLETLKDPNASRMERQDMILRIVAKGENEVYVNGRKLRCRNSWREEIPDKQPENDYTDGKSAPTKVGVGDVITLELRGNATFRGAIIGFVSEDEKKHIVFPPSSFRLIETGEDVKPEKADATEFAKKATALVRPSQPDGDMAALWREHGIEGSNFVQPPEKGVWAVITAVITDEMCVDAPMEKE